MKKAIFILLMASYCPTLFAQPGEQGTPPKRPSIEQRIKRLDDSIKVIHPTAIQKETIDAAYKSFYIQVDKITGDGPPPRPNATDDKTKNLMQQIHKLQKERDDKIEKVLNAAQMQQYKKIERSLKPRPPGNMPPPPQK